MTTRLAKRRTVREELEHIIEKKAQTFWVVTTADAILRKFRVSRKRSK